MPSPTPNTPQANSALADLQPELLAIRHQLHAAPELAFGEHATSALVAKFLRDCGYEVFEGIGQTGVVGRLQVGAGTRRLGLRADMDALPIQETTGLPHASRHAGVMHACGHDGHTTMLLGAAKQLARSRCFNGTLHLIFQPAEERGYDSGATAMLADGLFDRFPCDRIYAFHNHPGVDQGHLWMRSGAFMAAGDRVHVVIRGLGGHAARPHQAQDPVVAAAYAITALQTVVSRNVDPDQPAVVTVGRIQGGQALNVIPDSVEIGLSVRSFSAEVRALLKERICALIHDTARAHGCSASIEYVAGYPVLINDADSVALAAEVAAAYLPAEQVNTQAARLMGSEDFAFMLEQVPGAMLRIGNGPASGGRGLHNPNYDFHDDNLLIGAGFWCQLAERYLV